ncbi:MAG: type II toxin-antitoxin system RelE/ParE family toxin [Oscillospiraceae bacterium]|nr:type II toxin-antitoxin system RelE/ParE family toxin [Oscillospiraceae bacterium]
MKYRVVYLPSAKIDSEAIRRYLRQFSVKAAVRFKDTMSEKLARVWEYPQMYSVYRHRPIYRCMPVENCLLFYEVDEKQKIIFVARILHSAQDMPSYL